MLPTHRTTRNGRQEYDDDDKYSKRSWSSSRILTKNSILRKSYVRILLAAALLVVIYISFAYRAPRPGLEVVERWQQNGGKYDAGHDPELVRDKESNEVIHDQKHNFGQNPARNKKPAGHDAAIEPVAGEPLKFSVEDEADWQIMKELLDDDTVDKHKVVDDTLHVDSRAEPKNDVEDSPKALNSTQNPIVNVGAGDIPNILPPVSPPKFPKGQAIFTQDTPYHTLKNPDPLWASRQQNVIAAFQHAWKGYSTEAFGNDEYRPLSHSGEDWLPGGIGLMIVDALDTMLLMNLQSEYTKARAWVDKSLDFNKQGYVNLFETTIRVLGGLLSAYHLSGSDPLYLEKAVDLADRLMDAFQSPSGIPYSDVNLAGGTKGPSGNGGASTTAEVTTLQLEFKYLSHLTRNKKYWTAVEKVMKRMKELENSSSLDGASSLDGLVPIFINPVSGQFWGQEIRLGSRGDSYYEYLLKQYLQTSKTEPVYRQMYDTAIQGIKTHLVAYSHPSKFLFLGELLASQSDPKNLYPKMDHLVCFLGGNLALGATEGLSISQTSSLKPKDKNDLELGAALTSTCYEMYNVTATGLAPEIAYFERETAGDQLAHRFLNQQHSYGADIVIKPLDAHNLLRPETVESLFLYWRITGDNKYREQGWKIFQAFEKYTKLPAGGYAALDDVNQIPPKKRDRMDTFFLAETLKYLYLLFSPNDIIPLDHYVFNTEAHPLPIFKPQW
ncbi:endoplasmic reticulum mannosyl-oligosaccharide 1,2-alpha-mannosidase-like protein [Endogone sp. FLAS-F59071]|nr:endoplasmic reticulum mannosyl-oligosaccharide 1,2-alpha-mannosidase-like protein [Endogone sp. FLAS-F59071]|eukprot:RUS14175.1 endoplasmic reticulum mannosyl-oligosaccharide 1,2-alpha-mannosidase-like protein [Endogone sp. FLAS-F59071]